MEAGVLIKQSSREYNHIRLYDALGYCPLHLVAILNLVKFNKRYHHWGKTTILEIINNVAR